MLFFALMMVILLYGTLFLTNICQQYFFVRFAKMCKKIQSIWTSIRHQIDDLNHPNIHFFGSFGNAVESDCTFSLANKHNFSRDRKKNFCKKSIHTKIQLSQSKCKVKVHFEYFFARKDRHNYEIQSYDKILLFLLLSDYDCKLQFFQLSSHFQLHYYCM